jgi:hypothetical protein
MAAPRLIGFAAFAIGGCFAPLYNEGLPCGQASHGEAPSCPAGQSCVEGVCRSGGGGNVDASGSIDGVGVPDAIPSDANPLDFDGDGVLDSDDNCPMAVNTSQHDEDGDGPGDACDPCPHVAGASADADGDGVGDACDPSNAADNTIVFFDGFGASDPAWSFVGSQWSVAGDKLVQGDSSTNLAAGSPALDLTSATAVHVGVAGRILGFGNDINEVWLSAGEVVGPAYHDCYLEREPGAPQSWIYFERFDGNMFHLIDMDTIAPVVPGAFSITTTVRHDNNTGQCRMSFGAGAPYVLGGAAPTLARGGAVMRSAKASFELDYFMVIVE